MAKEATVGALLPIRRENYQARPVFASCTCKKVETSVSITPLYRAVIDYWHEKDEEYKQRGPIDDTAGSQVRWCIRSRRAQRTACLKKKKKKEGEVGRSLFARIAFFVAVFFFFSFECPSPRPSAAPGALGIATTTTGYHYPLPQPRQPKPQAQATGRLRLLLAAGCWLLLLPSRQRSPQEKETPADPEKVRLGTSHSSEAQRQKVEKQNPAMRAIRRLAALLAG
jgi:hypothetical protein